MEPEILKLIALCTIPTGVLTLVAVLGVWWKSPTRRETSSPREFQPSTLATFIPLLLLSLCAIALYKPIYQVAFPPFPPDRAAGAVPYTAIVTLVLGLLLVWSRVPRAACFTAAAIAVLGAGYLSLHNQLRADGALTKWGPTIGAYTVLASLLVWGVMRLSRRTGFPATATLGVLAFSASQVLMLGYNSMSHAILAATLCAVVGGVAVVTLLRPRATLGPAGAMALGVLLSGLLLQGAAFGQSDRPWTWLFALLLVASPWAAILAARWKPANRFIAGGAIIAAGSIPALTALGIAAMTFFRESAEGY